MVEVNYPPEDAKKLIQTLHERSGKSYSECRIALEDCDWDIEKSALILWVPRTIRYRLKSFDLINMGERPKNDIDMIDALYNVIGINRRECLRALIINNWHLENALRYLKESK